MKKNPGTSGLGKKCLQIHGLVDVAKFVNTITKLFHVNLQLQNKNRAKLSNYKLQRAIKNCSLFLKANIPHSQHSRKRSYIHEPVEEKKEHYMSNVNSTETNYKISTESITRQLQLPPETKAHFCSL